MCSRNVPKPIKTDVNLGDEGIQDRIYRDKLLQLETQLDELGRGAHPQYINQMEQLKSRLRVRQEYNEAVRGLEMELAQKWCEREERTAVDEYEMKKDDLLNSMLTELEEKRKQVEAEYHTMDLNSDCSELKPTSTRKLRRRPNEPAPTNDKRARKNSPTVVFSLNENEIAADLQLIQAGTKQQSLDVVTNLNGNDIKSVSKTITERVVICSGDNNVQMDCNKLICFDKTYVKGQAVIIETSDLGKWNGIINNISNKEVTLRNSIDGAIICISLNELKQGIAMIRKKNN